jgi:hypothetical protein
MHVEATDFVVRMKHLFPSCFGGKVLECGSFDINGNPRGFYQASEYVGIDWRPGPGVDEISLIHEYQGRPDGYFDVVVSMETLEHDPHWWRSVQRMVELLDEGGSILITCGGPGREAHCHETSPEENYYGNVDLQALQNVVLSTAPFRVTYGEYDTRMCDTRLFASGKLARANN